MGAVDEIDGDAKEHIAERSEKNDSIVIVIAFAVGSYDAHTSKCILVPALTISV